MLFFYHSRSWRYIWVTICIWDLNCQKGLTSEISLHDRIVLREWVGNVDHAGHLGKRLGWWWPSFSSFCGMPKRAVRLHYDLYHCMESQKWTYRLRFHCTSPWNPQMGQVHIVNWDKFLTAISAPDCLILWVCEICTAKCFCHTHLQNGRSVAQILDCLRSVPRAQSRRLAAMPAVGIFTSCPAYFPSC